MPRVDEARKAYERRDLEKTKKVHDKKRIEAEPWHDTTRGRYIRDVIYGASDGIVTTFAVVAGATGASLSSAVILILGFANLLADGFSMAAGNYLGIKSEVEYFKKEREREEWEVEHIPDAEREEVHQIFVRKGLAAHLADKLVELITSNKKVWVDFMMTEELGIIASENLSPLKNALATFLTFIAAGFMPLVFFVLSYTFKLTNTFILSTMTTALSLFTGLEMLTIGGAAATVAYAVGFILKTLVG